MKLIITKIGSRAWVHMEAVMSSNLLSLGPADVVLTSHVSTAIGRVLPLDFPLAYLKVYKKK